MWFRPIYKGFFIGEKNGPNSPDFELIKFQIARVSYDNFQKIAKNIKGL
jgi:hypothetical protein